MILGDSNAFRKAKRLMGSKISRAKTVLGGKSEKNGKLNHKLVTITKPTTIIVKGVCIKRIAIINGQGKIYYTREFRSPQVCFSVNIPDNGTYELITMATSVLKVEATPIIISMMSNIELPTAQKDTRLTLGKYRFIKNNTYTGSPASISTAKKEIYTNKAFDELPVYAQKFIMFHEMGHRYYYSEYLCDLYATKQMLKRGYNESSCVYALSKVLKRSSFATKRVENVFGKLDRN